MKNLGGMGGFGNILKQAQKMAEDAKRIEDQVAQARIEATSGGGMVKALVTGKGALIEIKIDPKAVDPEDVEMLEDLVTSAVREAQDNATKYQTERMEEITGGMGLPPGLI